MTHPSDIQPSILVVAEDIPRRGKMRAELERWFATDYRILEVDGPAAIEDLVDRLADEGRDVALVIAEQHMSETGTAMLGRVRDRLPTSRRVVLANWSDTTWTPTIVRASVLGDIDSVVGWPWSISDEQFLATIGDLLADWATEHGRFVESSRLLADPDDAEAQVLRDTVVRWAVPLGFYDARSEPGRKLAKQLPSDGELPAVFLPDGRVLSRPTIGDIANALGANAKLAEPFDVAIVGSGPAGLAAAVNSVSEGLRTLMIEESALGGQASSSPQIRNYLGFPSGVSGAELMIRGLRQAWAFGAQMEIGRAAVDVRIEGDLRAIDFDDGQVALAKAVVLAMGVSYRRLGVPTVERLAGRGVFYGAGATEAPAVGGADVFVVGGGNSGAQATINLARYARKVTLLVRGDTIDDISDYLVEQLRDRPNIEIRLHTEVVEARGRERLEGLILRDRHGGPDAEEQALALFILIGATPRTRWLPVAIERDPMGYVLTGSDVTTLHEKDRPSLLTRMPGVFAAGDVRHGSIKRVAAAVGEGATTIREIHDYLAGVPARELATVG